ncbi:MAG TPA: carboxypeptidase-like regulatory domain-containing protein [Pyrinomonadaceae bacterium]
MAQETQQRKGFKLEIPLDASGIEDFKPDMAVRVLLVDRAGKMYSQVTKLNDKGSGLATFEFRENPGSLRLLMGPESASDEELKGLQTISLQLPVNRVTERILRLEPVIISPYYWWWWHWWCRTFTITGRVVCPDGSPVPGANVCAYDVDWFWWWSSKSLVKCATTDATGSFSMTFKWCCGFWPWWWWSRRYWQLEPKLIELIGPQIQRIPKLRGIPSPQSEPDFRMFERLIGEEGSAANLSSPETALTHLDELRTALVKRLPASVELERLRIWPWWPFYPWLDCTPDIIFKVTQSCEGVQKVIIDESIFDTRANIPTSLNVTLVAEDACCIPPDDTPEGNCMVISQACSTLLANIGGNPGAPASPVGFANPAVIADSGDRPFAGNVPISGLFGDTAGVDYYEFEWALNPAGPWNTMPPAAAGGFTRWYWENVPPATAGPEDWHPVGFSFASISGRNVVESREHFEANNSPLSWGLTRFWVSNRDLLMQWLTENNFSDGTYYLRVKGWDLVAGNLANPRVLPLCGTEDDNYVTLRIDNRLDPDPGHVPPGTLTHPCGSGTVHTCTLEPDTDFLAVKLIRDGSEINIAACGNEKIQGGDILRIDFIADDPHNHLAYYTLSAIYAENLAVDLLDLGGTLTPLGGAPVPAAVQVGPNYGTPVYGPGSTALSQGATAPVWRGGAIRLEVSAADAFPETCCYQLELIAHKRTIVSCDYSLWGHSNKSTYALGITV